MNRCGCCDSGCSGERATAATDTGSPSDYGHCGHCGHCAAFGGHNGSDRSDRSELAGSRCAAGASTGAADGEATGFGRCGRHCAGGSSAGDASGGRSRETGGRGLGHAVKNWILEIVIGIPISLKYLKCVSYAKMNVPLARLHAGHTNG